MKSSYYDLTDKYYVADENVRCSYLSFIVESDYSRNGEEMQHYVHFLPGSIE